MTVTYTRTTNPPPAGNITLADDTEIDGSEGVVDHTGGFILAGGTADTAYNLKFLEDAELNQQDGDVRAQYGGLLIMEPGGTLTFDGDDEVYRFYINNFGGILTRGTAAKHCVIQGADGSNRMIWCYIQRAVTVRCEYLDMFHGGSTWLLIQAGSSPNKVSYFRNCTFEGGSTNPLGVQTGIWWFENCTIGDGSCTRAFRYSARDSILVLQDCTINQSNNTLICSSNARMGTVIYNTLTWTNATPANVQDTNPNYSSELEIMCKNITVSEVNNLEDCSFTVHHENFEDFYNPVNVDDDEPMAWPQLLANVLKLVNQMKLTDASGEATVMVPYKIKLWDEVSDTTTYYELSESGGSYAHNGQYTLSLMKDGYRFASTTLYGSSDQTWNVTLEEQATFDDILDCCNNSSANIDEILDLLENKLVINEETSELWLYNDDGSAVIKKWPIRDRNNEEVLLQGTGPANRLTKSMG